MSKKIRIRNISASGPGKQYSQVDFDDNVNIIVGPSNTGKSYLIKCIDFMFFGDIPFTKNATGYDTVGMDLEFSDGTVLSVKRKIVDGKKGEAGASKVEVVSPVSEYRTGEYTKNEFSALVLSGMGIHDHHKLVAYQDYRTENFGIRTMMHLQYIDEETILTSKSVIDNPKRAKPYAAMSILYFLLTGDDQKDTLPEISKKEIENNKIRKSAVLHYIYEKVDALEKKKNELEEILPKDESSSISERMEAVINQIAEVEKQIRQLTEESRSLMKQIYEVSGKLEEAHFLQNRYKKLHSQYRSDIKRLRFIAEGDSIPKDKRKPILCPFCDQKMDPKNEKTISYIEESRTELANVTDQIEDLKAVEKNTNQQIRDLEERMHQLNERNQTIIKQISNELRPRADDLREMLEDYKNYQKCYQQIEAITDLTSGMNSEAEEKQKEEDSNAKKYNPKPILLDAGWDDWSEDFSRMVGACKYPGKPHARIDLDTHDAVVGKKFKKDEGKGYKAFLNSLVLFSLMKWLEEKGTYRSGLLVLDSPILSLKEKKKNSGITEKDKADPGMRESLFQYIMDHCGDNQIIIAENEIPDTSNMDYSSANVIDFAESGFLKDAPTA